MTERGITAAAGAASHRPLTVSLFVGHSTVCVRAKCDGRASAAT